MMMMMMMMMMLIVMVTIIMMVVNGCHDEEDKDDEDEDDSEFCSLLHDWFVITWSFWMPLFFCGTGLLFLQIFEKEIPEMPESSRNFKVHASFLGLNHWCFFNLPRHLEVR